MNGYLNCTDGLQQSHVTNTFANQQQRINAKLREDTLHLTISIIAGIIFEAFAIKYFVSAVTATPEIPLKLVASILGLIFGGVSGGFLTYFLIIGIKSAAVAYKTNQLAKVMLPIKNRYEEKGLLDQSDISNVINIADGQSLNDLLEKMNLQQLLYARKAMGAKQFTQQIAKHQQEQFQILSLILSLRDQNTESIINTLNKKQVKLIVAQCPLITPLIREQLFHRTEPQLKTFVENYFLNETKKEGASETINISVGEQLYETTVEAIEQHCKTYKNMVESLGRPKDGKYNFTPWLKEYSQTQLSHFFQFLNQKPLKLSKTEFLDLLPIFSQLEVTPGLVENYAFSNIDLFEPEDLIKITTYIPECLKLKEYVLMKVASYKLSEDNWKSTLVIAKNVSDSELISKCKNFAKQKIISELKHVPLNLEMALSMTTEYVETCLDEDFQVDLASVVSLEFQKSDLKGIYEYAKAANNEPLLAEVKDYCKINSEEIRKNLPWKFEEIPEDLAELIYSPST